MQRESRDYLADILESRDAISTALSGMQIDDYLSNRLVRSSVEREFTIIGKAVLALSKRHRISLHPSPMQGASLTSAIGQPMSIQLSTMSWFGHSRRSIYRFSEENAMH